MLTTVLQQRLRAWRERFRPDNLENITLEVLRRPGRPCVRLDASHCAELLVNFRGGYDPVIAATRLGEVLRVIALTTAPHVDPVVFNSLWDVDGLCPMGVSLCTRCDEMDLLQEPIVNLAVRGKRRKHSGVSLIHDALYNWNEHAASAEFTQLRDALRVPDDAKTPLPRVQLRLVLGQYLEDDHDDAMCLRDLKALLARIRDATHGDAQRFRIARILPQGRTAQTNRRHYPAIFTTIINSGICTEVMPIVSRRQTPAQNPWQWLFDWAETTTEAPCIDELAIVNHGQKTDTLVKLLDLVVTKSATLQHLFLNWPLNLVDADAEQRCLAAEAIGAALFAPHSAVRLKTLAIDIGELTDDDVAALMRGAARSIDSKDGESSVTVRFDSVKWKPQATSEACIGQVARLFGAVGVRELEIDTGSRGLACQTLKTVLQGCPQLAKLEWCELLCDDSSELEEGAWRRCSGELRELQLYVAQGDGRDDLRAMNALLDRVGSQLTSLTLYALKSAFSGPMANVIVARCPQLRDLNVTNANAQFHEMLADAFDANRFKITSLTVHSARGSDGNECSVLLASLMEPTRGASRWLRSFGLGEAWTTMNCRQAAVDAFLEMLTSNLTLQRVQLYGNTILETRQKFKALPLQFVVRLPSMHRQLALVSVCGCNNNAQCMPKLPLDVLHTIFEFSGRCARRFWYVGMDGTI